MTDTRVIQLDNIPLSDVGNGGSFVAKVGRAGPMLGSTGLGCSLTVVPAGKRAYPFHRHHVIHEMFYVLSGEGELRIGEERQPIRAGSLIASPAGAEPHQIVNTSSAELRYLAFSTIGGVDLVEYPDSGKIAGAGGIKNADFRTATIKFLTRPEPVGYYDGEEPATK
ncbi:MAG TPA: cupin domain-containing protein [Micropepsaceae bacterium]|nr:cupin domain-containing protein [Micropepsaceae bacterium]